MNAVVTTLPAIEFEGKLVKPVRGKYKCPHNCHNPAFPAPSWKTETGFRKHMESCSGTPSAVKRQADLAATRAAGAEAMAVVEAARLGLSIGDEIFYVDYAVTGPTHVQRGARLVRLRYEELRSYRGDHGRIESFGWAGGLVINGRIAARDLCTNLDDAKSKAQAAQLRYDSHVEMAAACR
jgi:hypothetical protein